MISTLKKILRAEPLPPAPREPRRNDLCLCGSGRKYKRCCMPRSAR